MRRTETVRRQARGTRGWWDPVDVSQRIVSSVIMTGIGSTLSEEDGEGWSARICGSIAWALAMAEKSITGGFPETRALVSMRDRASATGLFTPSTCRMRDVVEVSCLPRRVSVRARVESVRQWLVVSEDVEVSTFQKVTKMLDHKVDC